MLSDPWNAPLTLGRAQEILGRIVIQGSEDQAKTKSCLDGNQRILVSIAEPIGEILNMARQLPKVIAMLEEVRDLLRESGGVRPARPSGCLKDVLTVLRHTGRRLTTGGILDALSAAGLDWGESTVKAALATAVDTGILTNDQRANPKGYWLTDRSPE